MSLAITSVVIAGLAVVVTVRLTTALIADRGGVRWSDLPFLSFVLLALVYLELSPSIAMVTRSLPRIALRQEHYVRLQLLLFVGFVPPLVFSYAWGRRREPTTARPPNPRDLLRFPWEASLVVCAVLRLVIAWRYGLWRLRIGDDVAEKTGATPFGHSNTRPSSSRLKSSKVRRPEELPLAVRAGAVRSTLHSPAKVMLSADP